MQRATKTLSAKSSTASDQRASDQRASASRPTKQGRGGEWVMYLDARNLARTRHISVRRIPSSYGCFPPGLLAVQTVHHI
jgi:hypothetical protein